MNNLPNFKEIDLKKHTSIQIGPVVKYLEIRSEQELVEACKYAKSKKLKEHVLGEGTNSYFAKSLKQYLFIKLNFSKEINLKEKAGYVYVSANANVNWHDLVMFTVNNNLWGLENLSLIPGSVGAAPVQNIGAYGVELKKTFFTAKVYDIVKNKYVTLKNIDCDFSYRHSIFKKFKNRYIIISVTFKLSKKRNPVLTYSPLNKLDKDKVTVKEISELVSKVRREKLPDYNIFPNSGSFFKNPKISFAQLKKLQKKFPNLVFFEEKTQYKIATAWFIEHILKMKGKKKENFGTAKTHALVIVNHDGNGEAKELNKFVKLITQKMKKDTGLVIEQEVNFVE